MKEGVCVEEVHKLLIDYLVDMEIMAQIKLKNTGTHNDDHTKQKVRDITWVKKEDTLLGFDGVFSEGEIAGEKRIESG